MTIEIESIFCYTICIEKYTHGRNPKGHIMKTGSEILMISRDIVINNTSGLHARPATFFIQKANSYPCSIWIEKDDRKVNAKSLLGVLSLGIAKGMSITLIADGRDEEAALEGLAQLIDSGFAEI